MSVNNYLGLLTYKKTPARDQLAFKGLILRKGAAIETNRMSITLP